MSDAVHPATVSFRSASHRQKKQAVKRSNHPHLVVPCAAGVRQGASGSKVRSAYSGMDPVRLQEVCPRPSDGTVSILMQYCVTFSTALAPLLTVWDIHCLLALCSSGIHKCRRCSTSCLMETLLQHRNTLVSGGRRCE